MTRFLVGLLVLITLTGLGLNFGWPKIDQPITQNPVTNLTTTPSPTPVSTLKPLPNSHVIPQQLHLFQSFNNCGPATLAMALSYVGINKSQDELGQILRPYQIPGGDNDDKSVTLIEVAEQARSYGLTTYLRPNGDLTKLKQLIANDIVVVTRTWLKSNEDIGHYRIVRGFDDATGEIIQDDSLQGKNLRYSYDEFNKLWLPFNYEYLVIVKPAQANIVEQILGSDLDEQIAWQNALTKINQQLDREPDNWQLIFAKSRIYYYLHDYQKSVEEFNRVGSRLSFRTLWYQTEPLLSIYETGDDARVLDLTDQILNNQNRAFAELYILRGQVYLRQNNHAAAKAEFEKALYYNRNLKQAQTLTSQN